MKLTIENIPETYEEGYTLEINCRVNNLMLTENYTPVEITAVNTPETHKKGYTQLRISAEYTTLMLSEDYIPDILK